MFIVTPVVQVHFGKEQLVNKIHIRNNTTTTTTTTTTTSTTTTTTKKKTLIINKC